MNTQASIFGLLIPGSEVKYNFQVIDGKGVLNLPNPRSVNVIAFFLTQPLPDFSSGAALYFTTPTQQPQFIGAIGNQRPSDIFHTGFALNPSVNIYSEISLIVQIEPLESLKERVMISQSTDLNKEFAKKNENAQLDGRLIVPINSLEKWYEKFNKKYDMDPNFVFKTDES